MKYSRKPITDLPTGRQATHYSQPTTHYSQPTTLLIIRLLTALRQAVVGVLRGRKVIGIIAGIGDSHFDVLHIGAVGGEGHFGDFLLHIHIHRLDALFPGKIILNALLAAAALYRRGFDGRFLGLSEGKGAGHHPQRHRRQL